MWNKKSLLSLFLLLSIIPVYFVTRMIDELEIDILMWIFIFSIPCLLLISFMFGIHSQKKSLNSRKGRIIGLITGVISGTLFILIITFPLYYIFSFQAGKSW
jgi:hypothetical protein